MAARVLGPATPSISMSSLPKALALPGRARPMHHPPPPTARRSGRHPSPGRAHPGARASARQAGSERRLSRDTELGDQRLVDLAGDLEADRVLIGLDRRPRHRAGKSVDLALIEPQFGHHLLDVGDQRIACCRGRHLALQADHRRRNVVDRRRVWRSPGLGPSRWVRQFRVPTAASAPSGSTGSAICARAADTRWHWRPRRRR
jgi:hypothetical protein